MRILLSASFSLWSFSDSLRAPAAPKETKAVKKKEVPLEFVIKPGDVSTVAVSEVRQETSIDMMKDGQLIPKGAKYYQTDKEFVPFYQVTLQLEPEAGKELETLTTDGRDKKLIIKAGGKKISEAWIKDAVGTGPLTIDPGQPKYDSKSDGTKESAESKASAEKLVKQLEKLIKKK